MDTPIDLTKWLKSSCSQNLKMMIERIIENNYIDSPGITMAKVRAKREGQDELCKELERLLIDIQTPLYLENRKAEEKKVNDIHQHFLDINWQKKADERKWNSIKEEVRIKEQQILKKKREEEQRISAQRFAEEEERKRKEALESPVKNIWDLYFITHIDNLQSISEKGILSPANVRSLGLHPVRIEDKEVNERRNKRIEVDPLLGTSRNLDELSHVFFNSCNAMLHIVLEKYRPKNIVIIEVSINVSDMGVYITDRNAALSDVQCWDSSQYREIIPQIERDTLPIGRLFDLSPYWCNDGSKGRVMAECLVEDKISSDRFKSIRVNSNDMIEKVRSLLVESPELEIKVDQSMFGNGKYD